MRTRFALLALVVLGACGSSDNSKAAIGPAPKSATSPTPQPTGNGTVKTGSFHSAALGVSKRYYIYLPAGYQGSTKRYPVIYMLHGLGGSEDNWIRHMGLAEAADAMKLTAIVVMPDGDDSFYVNNVNAVPYEQCLAGTRGFGATTDMKTHCVKQPRYESYIVEDLVAHVDRTYRTAAGRETRGIGGLSMGGFGALTLAMKHTDVYGAAASHSGVASILYAGPYPYVKGKVEITRDVKPWIARAGAFGKLFERVFGTDIAFWRANDPATLARNLRKGELALYVDCGTEDEFRLHNHAQYLHEVLEKAGIEHQFHLLPGRHNAAFWKDRIDDSLAFFAGYFARPPGSVKR